MIDAMVVLCKSPTCGAILRVGPTTTLLEVAITRLDGRMSFVCPRCAVRTVMRDRREDSLRRVVRDRRQDPSLVAPNDERRPDIPGARI